MSPPSAQFSQVHGEIPWANNLLEQHSSSTPDCLQIGASSNTEAVSSVGLSLFHEFGGDRTSTSLGVVNELISTDMPNRRAEKFRYANNDFEKPQAEVLLSPPRARDGATNYPGNIRKNLKRAKNSRSASSSSCRYNESKSKKRGRRGHLAPNTAKNAHEMRRLRACMLCRLEKVTVSLNQYIVIRDVGIDWCL